MSDQISWDPTGSTSPTSSTKQAPGDTWPEFGAADSFTRPTTSTRPLSPSLLDLPDAPSWPVLPSPAPAPSATAATSYAAAAAGPPPYAATPPPATSYGAVPQTVALPYGSTPPAASTPYGQPPYAATTTYTPYAQQPAYPQPAYGPYAQQEPPYAAVPGYGDRYPVVVNVNQGYPVLLPASDKSKVASGLLSIFLGCFGVGNFYDGHTGKGLAQLLMTLLSLGILSPVTAIWGLIEGIIVLASPAPLDGQGRVMRS